VRGRVVVLPLEVVPIALSAARRDIHPLPFAGTRGIKALDLAAVGSDRLFCQCDDVAARCWVRTATLGRVWGEGICRRNAGKADQRRDTGGNDRQMGAASPEQHEIPPIDFEAQLDCSLARL
jgi:hypothetical protein